MNIISVNAEARKQKSRFSAKIRVRTENFKKLELDRYR